jgi:hypothetical protein
MAFAERLRTIALGGAMRLVSGLLAAGLGFPRLFMDPPGVEAFAAGLALFVFAPVFVVLTGIGSWRGPAVAPAYVVAVGFGAITAPLFHLFVKARWGHFVTFGGLIAWIICQMYMALAATAL